MNLEKRNLPSFVEIDGNIYDVKVGFEWGLIFTRMVKENSLLASFDVFYENEVPEDRQKGFTALYNFYWEKHELPRAVGATGSADVLEDFSIDADYIFAAFYEQYGIDLFKEELHWHKFVALYRGLHDTKLNEIIGARAYDPYDKTSFEQSMRKRKQAWEILPTVENDEKLKEFMSMFN